MVSDKKILWVMGNKSDLNQGVANFSSPIIIELQKRGWTLDLCWHPEAGSRIQKALARFVSLPKQLKKIKDQYRYIVLKDHSYSYLAPSISGKGIVVVHHLQSTEQHKSQLADKARVIVDKLLLKNQEHFHSIVSVSESTKRTLLELGVPQDKVKVIYSPLDLAAFEKEPEPNQAAELFSKYKVPTNAKAYFLYVGTEENRKNVVTLIHLMNELKDKGVHLVKIGKARSNENRAKHLELIKELGLNNITLIDFVEQEDLLQFYKACSAFLFPSLFEGFGKPPLEAQASGMPIISTSAGALKEVLNDSALIINNPTDLNEWVQAIDKLSDANIKSELIRKGLENVERFSVELQAAKFEACFNS